MMSPAVDAKSGTMMNLLLSIFFIGFLLCCDFGKGILSVLFLSGFWLF